MKPRGARVVDAHISLERAAESYFGPIERDRHCQQFAAQENQRGPAFSRISLGAAALGRALSGATRSVFRIDRHLLAESLSGFLSEPCLQMTAVQAAYLIARA